MLDRSLEQKKNEIKGLQEGPVIEKLRAQVEEIERYQKHGGELNLPHCPKSEGICLIHLGGKLGCSLDPGKCGFRWQVSSPEASKHVESKSYEESQRELFDRL